MNSANRTMAPTQVRHNPDVCEIGKTQTLLIVTGDDDDFINDFVQSGHQA